VNESNLWEWLRDVALPIGHYSRIESHDTAPGFPDVHYQIDWNSGTIELKYAQNPNATYPFKRGGLRAAQKKWHKDATGEGANCWIIAEVPPMIFIIHGCEFEGFNDANREDLFNMSAAVVYREEPENAAKILLNILVLQETLQ